MITRIEIDGFKTFRDFYLDLSPIQVIVGPNASGKSNLFDALQLLASLADSDLRTAFQNVRGEASELFTILPNGESLNRMRLAVEMLVEREIQDSWGAQAELRYTRMRYELEISRRTDSRGLERLYVEHELLAPIARSKDIWAKNHEMKTDGPWIPKVTGGRSAPFISTAKEQGVPTLSLHQDGSGGRRSVVAEQTERTVLSGIQNTEFPHALAVAEEMRSWRFLQLNPDVLRLPGPMSMTASTILATDGQFLPNVLARLQNTDPFLLTDISRDMANLVPGILQVELEEDHKRNQYVVWVQTEDGGRFSSRVLSDGTLRMLVLATLKNDPTQSGLLCFEEPENGVHPFRLRSIAQLLRDLATDFSDPDATELPLRQVLCNTHSPVFISFPEILGNVLFAYTATRIVPQQPMQTHRVTRMVSVRADPKQISLPGMPTEEQAFTLSEVKAYLESADLGAALDSLQPNGSKSNGAFVGESYRWHN
ncbi:MAG: DUF2813 domain-containing protein [Chloroflexi bacterium]|nr:MAG: DUF2813 domain-containing protein [Chloroflexota bacterium]